MSQQDRARLDDIAPPHFDTDHAIVQDVVDNELTPLLDALSALIERSAGDARS